MDTRWQLRCAAGKWWVLDTEQTGDPFCPPLTLNETAARLWLLARQGGSTVQLASALSGVTPPPPEAEADVTDFLAQLRQTLELRRV